MKILLDTNALIWTAYKNDYNSNRIRPVKDILLSLENKIFVSVVSFWEIAIKVRVVSSVLRVFMMTSQLYCLAETVVE